MPNLREIIERLEVNIAPAQLRQAADIQEKIQSLQTQMNQLLGTAAEPVPTEAPKKSKRGRKKMSPAAKAKMAALMKARWAKCPVS
jgi:hypothetical protein